MVYFIRAGETGAVKIGYVQAGRSIERRLVDLQVGNPDELHLLAVAEGGPALERKLHRAFSESRIRGEWFKWSPLLAKVIAAYQDDPAVDFFNLKAREEITLLGTGFGYSRQRRAAQAAFERALADGSMTIRYETAGESLDNDA